MKELRLVNNLKKRFLSFALNIGVTSAILSSLGIIPLWNH